VQGAHWPNNTPFVRLPKPCGEGQVMRKGSEYLPVTQPPPLPPYTVQCSTNNNYDSHNHVTLPHYPENREIKNSCLICLGHLKRNSAVPVYTRLTLVS